MDEAEAVVLNDREEDVEERCRREMSKRDVEERCRREMSKRDVVERRYRQGEGGVRVNGV